MLATRRRKHMDTKTGVVHSAYAQDIYRQQRVRLAADLVRECAQGYEGAQHRQAVSSLIEAIVGLTEVIDPRDAS
jgi:hypothetical protein